jgi:hypothetical protein
MENKCSGYIVENGKYGVCKHGFPQTVGCTPWKDDQGRWHAANPVCCSEEVCARLFPKTGQPEIQRAI